MATVPPADRSVNEKPVPARRFNPWRLFTGIFLPECICRYRGLSAGAKIVLGRLFRFAGKDGKAFPSRSTIGRECGMEWRQAARYLAELEYEGFVEVDRADLHYRKDGSGGTPTYYFLRHPCFDSPPPMSDVTRVPMSHLVGVRGTKCDTLRESSSKRVKLRESVRPAGSGKIPKNSGKLEPKPARSQKNQAEKPKTKKPDDDETPKGTAWEQLRGMAPGLSAVDERWLKDNMGIRGITAEQLLKLAKENPPEGFTNRGPVAGLKWLVKWYHSKTQSAEEREAELQTLRPLVYPEPPKFSPSCTVCKDGVLEDGFCSCKAGELRRQIAERFPERKEMGSAALPTPAETAATAACFDTLDAVGGGD